MAHCLNRPAPRLARLLRRVAALERLDNDFQSRLPELLCGHCHIAACRDGQVVLHVDSSAWATRLRYAVPELRESGALPRDAKVDIRVRPLVTVPEVIKRRPNGMSTDAAQVLLDCSEHLGDADLSASLRRLARHGGRERTAN